MKISLNKELCGSILDIGGGGEGIIGRLYKSAVTAVDNMQEELDEAPSCCKKLLMDAAALDFADESFDNVTFFYSLMYMNTDFLWSLTYRFWMKISAPNTELSEPMWHKVRSL
mgnify:CR=1 FL=1